MVGVTDLVLSGKSHTRVMAVPVLPQDVAEHLETAIQLSNGRVHLRFLDEAEGLLSMNLPDAAILIAGVVLEFVLANVQGQGSPDERQRVRKWLELRHRVAHGVTVDEAEEMVEGVQELLTITLKVAPEHAPLTRPPARLARYGENTNSCLRAPPSSSVESWMKCNSTTVSRVIDASAPIAFLRNEPGAEAVANALARPQRCYAHALNLCEVYYDFWRASSAWD